MAISLDGFVARKDHNLDWLMKHDTEGEDPGYDDFISRMDGIVMGRGSFQTVLTFDHWPYQKPVVVMSKTMTQTDIPKELQKQVTITTLPPDQLMQSLASEGWVHAYIDGGQVVQSFIKANLIEDMVITITPILIGDGIRMFGELDADIDLELVSSRKLKAGFVQSHYRLLPNQDHG